MVVNIDWLQLSVYEDKTPQKGGGNVTIAELSDSGELLGFLDDYGGDYPRLRTVFKKDLIDDVYLYYTDDDFIYLGELMRQRWDLKEALLRFDNELLYKHNLARDTNFYRVVLAALDNSGWTFKHITRCDICIDFQPAETPILGAIKSPPDFIRGVVNGDITRCSHGAKMATMSTNQKKTQARAGDNAKIVKSHGDFSYIRFSNYLPTSVLYNKSLEFRTKSLKSYIPACWLCYGMDDTAGDVWRLELRFNFKGSAYSEAVCRRLHNAFNSSPTPIDIIYTVVNEYVSSRLNFSTKKSMRKLPIFEPEIITNGGVTACNLTEYKLYAKLPRVSSYHIGICKYLRGFLHDLKRKNISSFGVPVESIEETANFIMQQCESLTLYRQGLDIKNYVKSSFWAVGADALRKDVSARRHYEALTEDARRKVLEISYLEREIKDAKKLKNKANTLIINNLHNLISLKEELSGSPHSPV